MRESPKSRTPLYKPSPSPSQGGSPERRIRAGLAHVDKKELEHLAKLLTIWGWLCAVGGGAFLALFLSIAFGSEPGGSLAHAWLLAGPAAGIVLAFLNLKSSQMIRARQNRGLVAATAGMNCFTGPLGLAVGVYTLVVMGRPSIRAAFR